MTLCIEFQGICTHFHHNALPEIPHRVVIPDAAQRVIGTLSVPTSWPN